ncbi:hypothetical protein BDR03DRAFT_982589 [Suillus americanus]|nr:hypothetical protein BDR03DRAFT_982589 [Suillus americanus]
MPAYISLPVIANRRVEMQYFASGPPSRRRNHDQVFANSMHVCYILRVYVCGHSRTTLDKLASISLACALIILIRYASVATIVVSNCFSTTFTQQTCQQYYLVPPIFKAVQTMKSQVTLGVRTLNITRRDRQIGIALLLLYFISFYAEWFSVLFHGSPSVFDFYYLAVMLYDIVMVAVSTLQLLHYNPLSNRVEQLIWVNDRAKCPTLGKRDRRVPNTHRAEKEMSGLRSHFESKSSEFRNPHRCRVNAHIASQF